MSYSWQLPRDAEKKRRGGYVKNSRPEADVCIKGWR
jgi:hypothetical protein